MTKPSNGPSPKPGDRKRSPKSAPPEDQGEIRDKILRGAEDVFARYGLHGATTAMIAAAAGISKPHIYYYFSSKETLYNAVLERTLTLWNSVIPMPDQDVDPRRVLETYIAAKLEFSQHHPRLSRIFANEILNGAPILRGRIKTDAKAALGRLVALLDRWQAEGRIKPVDSAHLVFMIWGMTQYYANSAAELEILLGKKHLDDTDFAAAKATILKLVFSATGLEK
jgi:TetR/AcrR family transcriptional regulator